MKIYDYSNKEYITEDKMQIGKEYRVNDLSELAVKYEIVKKVYDDVLVKKLPSKYSVSAKCSMYQSEDKYERTLVNSNYHRELQFELTITSDDEDTQDYIFDKIESYMTKKLQEHDFQFSSCPTIENGTYWDCASIEYQYGCMTEIKKDIMTAYKEAKKQLR